MNVVLMWLQGLQVAPAELEAHLLAHPAVADVCVIPVPDDAAGELPKAYVVKSSSIGLEDNDRMIIRDIQRHVEKEKARHKWLKARLTHADASKHLVLTPYRAAWNLSTLYPKVPAVNYFEEY